MKATAQKSKSAPKKADRIPFDEMCRLMRVYGSTKCLRNRQKSGGMANMKVESVKRKFYRWFPDLDERFGKDDAGFYRPKFGHEFEIRYRQELRTKDKDVIAKKRIECRKQRRAKEVAKVAAGAYGEPDSASVSTRCSSDQTANSCAPSSMVTPTPPPNAPLVLLSSMHHELTRLAHLCEELTRLDDTGIKIEPNLDNDRVASVSIVEDSEPLDNSFVAKQEIFDNVEESIYRSREVRHVESCPTLESSSSCGPSWEEEACSSASSWGGDATPSAGDGLNKSMEEHREEILAPDDDGQGQGF